ncbi:MAG: M23 family metallopeptidase [Gammaproteobacteria bacterium]|nr:MAG: M23 family metallopeptidase [Gammaproteobacteria bacterium]
MVLLACWPLLVVADPIRLEGVFTQGGILRGQVAPGTVLALDGEPVPVSPSGAFVIGFDRDAATKARLQAVLPSGVQVGQDIVIRPRQYDIQRVTGVPEATVNPPAEVLERIEREAVLVSQAREGESALEDFAQPFQWPLLGPVTGVFGSQRVYNGVPKRPHYGVDVAAPVGTVVVAPVGGVVTLVHDDMFYSGGTLVIDHGHGLTSTFIHLNRVLVKAGQRVEQGDEIAEVGAKGRASGPHLDWRMNWRDRRLDPVTVVGPMPSQHATQKTGTGDAD